MGASVGSVEGDSVAGNSVVGGSVGSVGVDSSAVSSVLTDELDERNKGIAVVGTIAHTERSRQTANIRDINILS